ncbi:MAG TPA: Panacea domain-containing protein [Solirubrobacteraceae bacterium]
MSDGFSLERFRELVLYFAEESVDDPLFGATKLNKMLAYADFYAYAHYGESLTGATYRALPNGPVAEQMDSVRTDLLSGGEAVIEQRERYGYVQHRLVPQRKARPESVFSEQEQQHIGEILQLTHRYNAAEISDKSHRDFLGWDLAATGDEIPYSSIFVSRKNMPGGLIERGQQLAAEHGWL